MTYRRPESACLAADRTAHFAVVAGVAFMMVFALFSATNVSAQGMPSCGNQVCEPQLGEYHLPDVPRNYCSQDCYCGNGSCDIPTGQELVLPELRYQETSVNCPADCSATAPVTPPTTPPPTGNPSPAIDPSCVPARMVYTETTNGVVAGDPLPPVSQPLTNGVLGPFNPNESQYHCYVSGGLAWAPNCATNKCQCPTSVANFSAPCNDPATREELGLPPIIELPPPAPVPPAGGTPTVCATGYSCGALSGGVMDTCVKQGAETQLSGATCTLPIGTIGSCYKCLGEDGNKGNEDGDPPLMCPAGCVVDADCGNVAQCDKQPNNPGKDACWMDPVTNSCVKNCKVPKCVNKQCAMVAAPAPTACAEAECPAPRCGDGILHPGTPPDDGDDGDDDDDDDDGELDWDASRCPDVAPLCGYWDGSNGGSMVTQQPCPDGGSPMMVSTPLPNPEAYRCGSPTSINGQQEQEGICYRCLPPEDDTVAGCTSVYPLCATQHLPGQYSFSCPNPNDEADQINIACTKGNRGGLCYRCVPYGTAGRATCGPAESGCTYSCREPYCTTQNGRDITNEPCFCRDPVNCTSYVLPSGEPSATRPAGCRHFNQGTDGRCLCVMAAGPSAPSPVAAFPAPKANAPVASLLKGSSLLATSIINSCQSCNGVTCGTNEACFALIGANKATKRCAPANCAGREEECGMEDELYGANIISWQMCGTAPPPVNPDDPPVVPVPEGGEQCDDGNNASNDGCGPSCQKEICGDGITQPKGADGKPNTADDETCDDGNRDLNDGCDNTCKAETCGNGTIDYGEECDKGSANSDTEPGACRKDCMLPKCNDGVIDTPLGEQCDCGEEGANFDWEANKDDASTPYCDVTYEGKPAICHFGSCTVQYCGDGTANNAGLDRESGTADDEMCDAGPLNTDFAAGSGKCTTSAQCGSSSVCIDETCVNKSCSGDADCGDGACVGNVCKPGGCDSNADCPQLGNGYGYNVNACTEGSCRQCNDHSQCASGVCNPSGSCGAVPATPPEAYCRMDCKRVRCGDGIVDTAAGETCDEGEAMFKCDHPPFESCSCGIPSYGSHERPLGTTFDQTCCSNNEQTRCVVRETATCPIDCGVSAGRNDTGGVGICGNHRLEYGEDCDTSVPGWQGQFSDWADAQVDYAYRPVRDGTSTAFTSDDGRWVPVPSSIEDMYTTIDHSPSENSSPDQAWIITSGQGTARTYFHLWDVPLTTATIFSNVRVRVGVDFTGEGRQWKVLEAIVPLKTRSGTNFTAVELNAAVLEIVADEAAHTLTFQLFHSVTGEELSYPLVMQSPDAITGSKKIALDAVEIAAFGTSLDESYSCEQCVIVRCGNGRKETGEQCDDGNSVSGDGCTERCEAEICAVPA